MAMNINFNTYMRAEKFSAGSVKVYTRNINECLKYLDKPEAEVTELDLMAWKESLDGLASATIAQKITCAKTYFKFLKRHHFIESNPAEDLESVKITNKEKHHMTAEQVKAMMDVAGSIKMKAMIALMASTGLRISEVTGITLEQYNTMKVNHDDFIYIFGKGNKKRPIFFNQQSRELVDRYIKVRERGEDYLFLSREGNKIARNNFSNSLKVVARDAGIPWAEDFCPHQLRVAFATIQADMGVPVTQIRDGMGHASVETTNRYLKASEQDIKQNVMSMSF